MDKYQKIRDKNNKEEISRFELIESKYPEIFKLLCNKRDIKKSFNVLKADTQTYKNHLQNLKNVNEKIEQMLVDNGFEKNYLDPIYDCSLCKDMGYIYTDEITKVNCKCNAIRVKKEISFKDMNLNLFSKEKYLDYEKSPYENTKDIIKYCKKFVEKFPECEKANMLLYGPAGIGKSYIASAICCEIIKKGYSAIKVNAFSLNEDFKNKHVNDKEYNDNYYDCDLLIIDDIGTEPKYNNVTINYLFDLVNYRYENGLSTIYITNLRYNDCVEKYDERIGSRIFDKISTKRWQFYGNNLRIN